MAVYWMTGSLLFFNRWEPRGSKPPKLKSYPLISILVPCHNEEKCIRDAILQLASNHYPNFEIIAINDGSNDTTEQILHELSAEIEALKVINLTKNYGKAMALKVGVLSCAADYVMCIDADALLDKDALFWMMQHFQNGPRVGAVTGNPRVINRTSLLGRIQIGEFSAIVGMVKRTQRGVGRIFTISGVNACFRKSALHDVGYWSPDTVTEDIDISWKLQMRRWDIRYEPHALTWILVPENIRALWKQRLRWAQGGYEAAVKFFKEKFTWKNRRMWIVSAEYWLSVAWCYALVFTVACFGATHFSDWFAGAYQTAGFWPQSLRVETLVPGWTGVVLAVVCLAQFAVGLSIDGHYERRGLFRYMFWAIWYPALYWFISAATTVVAVPKGIMKRGKAKHAIWQSPVRALQYSPLRIREVRKQTERRYAFWNLESTRKFLRAVIMFVSWGLWAYLITPLISLMIWGIGAYLVKDRLLTEGSYETFSKVFGYGGVILTMWCLLAVWIAWNQLRYGRHNRRHRSLPHISPEDMSKVMGLQVKDVQRLRNSKEAYLHFDEADSPIIERLETELSTQSADAVPLEMVD
jgi:biofilm PGA synthesis N-glycosyltransferase PgaC